MRSRIWNAAVAVALLTVIAGAPSGQTPPYVKPTRNGRAKPKGGRPGHPGHRRPTPTHIDRREEHAHERPVRNGSTRNVKLEFCHLARYSAVLRERSAGRERAAHA